MPCVGTCVGVPLLEFVASAALSKVARRIEDRMKAEAIVSDMSSDDVKQYFDPDGRMARRGECTLSNFGIVDYDVFIAVASPGTVHDNFSRMAAIVFEECARAALPPHLQTSKTAAVLTWHGPGKSAAQHEFAARVNVDGGVKFKAMGIPPSRL